jgi:hypothetical protein
MNLMHTIVIFASLTVQASAQGTTDTCLLQTQASKRASRQLALAPEANHQLHQNWRAQHKLLLTDTSRSMDVLSQFIQQQQESGDACSARLLESKRILDGLLHDVKSLSVQVDSHEEVIETETGNLGITELSVKAVDTTHKEAGVQCETQTQEAVNRVSQYQSELAELDQIAKPSVRYSHVTKIQISETTKTSEPAENTDSLLQEGGWSKDSCLAFLSFQKKHMKSAKKEDPDKKRDCDAEREELQEAFTEAYIETRDLLKEAQDDSADTSCVETADARKAASLVPLISQRERASSLIESSTQSVAALQPVLDLVDSRVAKMTEHINVVLTPECSEAKEVSETLAKIRELILSIEKCPGRNDFKLKIPEEEAEEVKQTGVEEIIKKDLGQAEVEPEDELKNDEYIKAAEAEQEP